VNLFARRKALEITGGCGVNTGKDIDFRKARVTEKEEASSFSVSVLAAITRSEVTSFQTTVNGTGQ
jgi:NRPS condensation-like uncharacterized protein